VTAHQARARVAAILERLPSRHRTLLALMLVEQLSAAETAGALGTSSSEVETAYRNVLAELGRGLNDTRVRTGRGRAA